jgi:queuine tRNA-ribosyltransferase
VQGGRFLDLRQESARVLTDMDFDGYAIGGSFSKDDLGESLKVVNEILPSDKPRHLLGIGEPEDIVQGVLQGCDTFDCVAPTRVGRTGTIYVHTGATKVTPCGTFTYPEIKKINLMNEKFKTDHTPLDSLSTGYVAQKYTKAYVAHLFRAGEILGPHLASIHNLNTIVNFTKSLREQLLAQ